MSKHQIPQNAAPREPLILVFYLAIFCSAASESFAQQANVTTPLNGVSSQFSQQIGGVAIGPQVPGRGIGFGGNNGGVQLKFRLFGEQGYSQNLNSVAPTVTTLNGYPATIYSGIQTPFVTSITPIVASGPSPVRVAIEQYGIDEIRRRSQSSKRDFESSGKRASEIDFNQTYQSRRSSTAAQGDISVAEIRARKSRVSRAKHKRRAQIRAALPLSRERNRTDRVRQNAESTRRRSSRARQSTVPQPRSILRLDDLGPRK